MTLNQRSACCGNSFWSRKRVLFARLTDLPRAAPVLEAHVAWRAFLTLIGIGVAVCGCGQAADQAQRVECSSTYKDREEWDQTPINAEAFGADAKGTAAARTSEEATLEGHAPAIADEAPDERTGPVQPATPNSGSEAISSKQQATKPLAVVTAADRRRSSEQYAEGFKLALGGKYDVARARFRKALEINPFNLGATTSLEMLDAVSRGRLKKEAATCLLKAAQHIQAGESDAAIAQSKRAVALQPDYPAGYGNMGHAYLEKKQVEQAGEWFRKAVQRSPKGAVEHHQMATYWIAKGKWDKAIDELEKVVTARSSPAITCMALNNIGLAYGEKGLLNAAIAYFKNVLAINRNDAEAHYNLACHYYYKREFELAISHSDKAKQLGREIHPDLSERLRPYR